MLRKRHLLSTAVLIAGTLTAADYCFPSPVNPADLDPSEVEQYITILWNDNPLTGLDGTWYDSRSEGFPFSYGNCVGGKEAYKTHGFPSWIPNRNELNIEEGDIGMAWAMQLGVPMTFNMRTGYYIPVSNPEGSPDIDGDGMKDGWANRESPLGFWVPNEVDKEVGMNHTRYAVSWGTQQEIYDMDYKIQPACHTIATNQAIALGHEIGNNTLDGMTHDSPLPGGNSPFAENGFGRWNNEGFDFAPNDTTPWGEVFEEDKINGYVEGMSALTMGWKIQAGRYLSDKAWGGAIDIAEEWLIKQSDVTKETLYGFKAPRSEVNSGLYSALVCKNYLYDCSLEEGMEEHRDGKNFLWPYTVDNGSPHTWTKQFLGEHRYIDEMPNSTGLWELPINCLIVPEGIRDSVWSNRAEILAGEGYETSEIDEMKAQWLPTGKIKGSDFETMILWGMRSVHWKKTMENALQLRLEGNKAPFIFDAHSELYTPDYDYNVLRTDFKKNNWGLALTKDWHNWQSRIVAMEEWITWAQGKGCMFVTGKGLIDEIKKIQDKANWPGVTLSPWSSFHLYKNSKLNTKANHDEFRDSAHITITIAAPEGNEYPYPAYYAGIDAEDISHLSLDYQITNGALAIRLDFEGCPSREILLNNVNTKEFVHSGKIPISAFDFNRWEVPENIDYHKEIDFSKLETIGIIPLAPLYKSKGELRTEPHEMSFKIKNLNLYSKKGASIIENSKQKENFCAIQSLSKSAMKLWIAEEGNYTITIVNTQGRLMQQWNPKSMTKGEQTLRLNNLSGGIYFIEISEAEGKLQLQQKMKI